MTSLTKRRGIVAATIKPQRRATLKSGENRMIENVIEIKKERKSAVKKQF